VVYPLDSGDRVPAGMPNPARIDVLSGVAKLVVSTTDSCHVGVVGVLLVPCECSWILAPGTEDADQRIPECLPEILIEMYIYIVHVISNFFQ